MTASSGQGVRGDNDNITFRAEASAGMPTCFIHTSILVLFVNLYSESLTVSSAVREDAGRCKLTDKSEFENFEVKVL